MARTYSRTPLSDSQITERLSSLQGWVCQASALTKTFTKPNFVEALAFIVQVGFVSEALNHHAHIHNVYGTVTLSINTHDSDAITELDFEWARRVESIERPFLAEGATKG